MRSKPNNIDTVDLLHNSGKLPKMITEDGRTTIFSHSPNNSLHPNQVHNRMISASREVTGKSNVGSLRYNPREYVKVRYSGNAYGGFHMTDSDYPRKTNLRDRKQEVLKIATENYKLV